MRRARPTHRSGMPQAFASLMASALAATLLLIGCDDHKAPKAPPAIDRQARAYLRVIASRDLDAIRKPLSEEGKQRVTPHSLTPIFGYFEEGPPADVILLDAEAADSREPTPAERYRLTYRLEFPDERSYYYFFEMTIESGDSAITGFMIEPREKKASDEP